ncbi:hypothetical protein ACFL67_03285, partial [candidate division KSB1 bacterium]
MNKIEEFIQIVEDLFAVYKDSISGYDHIFRKIENDINTAKPPENEKKSCWRSYALDYPEYKDQKCIVTKEEALARNKDGGSNSVLAANMFIIALLSYWDHN